MSRAASAEFQAQLDRNSTLLIKATLALADGTTLSLDGLDFMAASFEEATSSTSSFDIGAAIIGQCNVELNNHTSKFDEYDFDGAELRPYVGKELSDGTVEWLKMGVFTADQPDSYSGTVDLSCLDNMSKFEVAADISSLSFPMTVNALVNHACSVCDVDFPQLTINRGSYSIQSAPVLSDATWLDVIGYACQVTCNWAKCDMDGRLVIDWYSADAFSSEDWLDDKYLDDGSPKYESGDTADGGTFDNYGGGDSVFGGDFDTYRGWGVLSKTTSLTVNTDDVVITGVRVTAQNEVVEDGSGQTGETALQGSEGYVLDIDSNPLVLYGQAASVASQVGAACIGMTFRPFSCSAFTDPTITSGDAIIVLDRKGNEYRSFCTCTKLSVNNQETFECNAESASRNLAKSAGATTSAYVAARKQQKRDMSSWDNALENLGTLINNSSGLFISIAVQSDGSYIFYMHDKKELENSQIIYEISAAGSRVSTDGGKTWNAGISADGDAVLKRIYAIGIDADYINTGAISIKDSSGKTIAMVGNGVESGLAVLSPYDNKTMLPLSWLAFSTPSANTDNSAYYCYHTTNIRYAPSFSEQDVEYSEAFEFMTADSNRVKFDITADLTHTINLPSVSWSGSKTASYQAGSLFILMVQCRKKGEGDSAWQLVGNSGGSESFVSSWQISNGSYSQSLQSAQASTVTFSSINSKYGTTEFESFTIYEARLMMRVSYYGQPSGISNVTVSGNDATTINTGVELPAFVASPIR